MGKERAVCVRKVAASRHFCRRDTRKALVAAQLLSLVAASIRHVGNHDERRAVDSARPEVAVRDGAVMKVVNGLRR